MDEKRKARSRTPAWLGNMLFALFLLALFVLPDRLLQFFSSTYALIGFFAATAVALAASMVWSMRRLDPKQVIAEADLHITPQGLAKARRLNLVLAGGLILCIALLGVVSFLILPGEGEKQAGFFLYGVGLILAGLSLPLLVVLGGWAAGAFLKPARLSGEYVLTLDGDPRIALAARANADRIVETSEEFSRAERLPDGSGRYRMHPSGLTARFLGASQIAAFRLASDRSSLEVRTHTVKDDRETLLYRRIDDLGGKARLLCRLDTQLNGALMKLIARILGHDHLLKGGALVEARRFSRLTGQTVELDSLRPLQPA